jgi:hypothetical protein
MSSGTFEPFDPLEVRNQADTSLAAQRATRREIDNILSSYVGWYDPFGELVQNALDAVDRRMTDESHAGSLDDYDPTINVIIDIDENVLTVSDNGTGMSAEEFRKFLAPNFSFKEEDQDRGHKGVGATYLAYGFNFLRVHTKQPGHTACGRLVGARSWTKSQLGTDPPMVDPDASVDLDAVFASWVQGTSVTVRFDDQSLPSRLDWLKATDADTWATILRIRTGVGSVTQDIHKSIRITCIKDGNPTEATLDETSYFWLRSTAVKTARLRDLVAARKEAFEKKGNPARVAAKFKDLIFVYDQWNADELSALMYEEEAPLHADIIEKHQPRVEFEYGYTTRLWKTFNEKLGIRANMNVVKPGIQLAANRMPQGDVIQVALTRYIGRQNQVHFLIHFENYTPDLGRKGFSKPLVEFASDLTKAIVQVQIPKIRENMKKDSGAAPDLGRQLKLDEWKNEMLEHEKSAPLKINSDHFFHPTKRISITSIPTREQDVIALFHEMISGGVIRGIKVMATNERLTYDSLCRISFKDERSVYEYDEKTNPLGVVDGILDEMLDRETSPQVLEYKFSLDGLMSDLDAQEKNMSDLDLCVAWELGSDWEERYAVTTLLIPENVPQREFHGATHILQDPDSGAKQVSLIILSDLVEVLVTPELGYEKQRERFE